MQPVFLWKGEIWTQTHTKGRWYKERKGETKWCSKLLEAKVTQHFRRERKANHSARPIKFCLIDIWKLGCISWSVFFSSYKNLRVKSYTKSLSPHLSSCSDRATGIWAYLWTAVSEVQASDRRLVRSSSRT